MQKQHKKVYALSEQMDWPAYKQQHTNTVILYAVTDDNKSVNSSVEMSLYVCGDISAEQRVWGTEIS